MNHDVYGGKIPAMTFKDIVDGIWAYDSQWGNIVKGKSGIPEMETEHISIARTSDAPVPDLKGLGLRDALYAIENNGYRCSYKGTGHVISQSPAAGTKLNKGQTISITLR
jgi:cell division protein FtsI (penicillin-binding protein 3)